MEMTIRTRDGSYPIFIGRGEFGKAGERFSLQRRCLILTDTNIPEERVRALAAQCAAPTVVTLEPGEESKTLQSFEQCLRVMLRASFCRSDCVIALGGGVVGDLAGFVASAWQRGVDFYNIPTTLLSQVDSSVGGKVAVNLDGVKNMVGAFYPPKAVLIDPDLLSSLPRRQLMNGMAEVIKTAVTHDEDLFAFLENENALEKIETVIRRSLAIKRSVVEQDEREAGLRRVLNFGHTLAHAIETESHRTKNILYHGECVALGMIPMCAPAVRERLIALLKKYELPTEWNGTADVLIETLRRDKKAKGEKIAVVRSDRIGTFCIEEIPLTEWEETVKGWYP